MLKSGTISCPHAEVLDTVERYYTHRMMGCSSVQMAEGIYRAAQSMPGASTTKCFLAQHGLQVYIILTCHWPRLWLMFAVTKGRLILCGIPQHIPFVVVWLDGSSSHTSALGKTLIPVECLPDCGMFADRWAFLLCSRHWSSHVAQGTQCKL